MSWGTSRVPIAPLAPATKTRIVLSFRYRVIVPGVSPVTSVECGGSLLMTPGNPAVARQAASGLATALRAAQLRPALVNGAAGVVVTVRGRPVTVMGFTIAQDKIVEIDAIADPERVRSIMAAALDDE